MTTPRNATPARPRAPRPRLGTVLPLVLVAAALAASPARAHQYWLAPTPHAANPPRPVGGGALAGTGFRGEAKTWSPARSVRVVARPPRRLHLSRAAPP